MAHRYHRWLAGLMLIGLLVLAPAASAQVPVGEMQGQIDSPGVQESPETLPGTYRAPVTVLLQCPGGQFPCLATETTVEFQATDLPDGIEATFEPNPVVIDWAETYQEQMSPAGHAERTVNVTLQVPASYTGQGDHKITLDAEATNDPDVQGAAVAPTQLTLSFPAAEDPGGEEPTGASDEEPQPSSSPSSNASTGEASDGAQLEQASEPDDEEGSPVPGVGALAAVLALAVVAWRRRS